MNAIEKAVQYAVNIADDNSHGYSQTNRWGTPDFDCSSLVISAWQFAGVPVKDRGATYTGNMYAVFCACGFADVSSQINLASGEGLQRGDVLLNHASHTAIALGAGKIVHARSSEGNSLPGDQSGAEIRTQGYFNYPWSCVLRYMGSAKANEWIIINEPLPPARSYSKAKMMIGYYPLLSIAFASEWRPDTANLQILLIDQKYDCEPTGYFDAKTVEAVKAFQKNNRLLVDGECGQATWRMLLCRGENIY